MVDVRESSGALRSNGRNAPAGTPRVSLLVEEDLPWLHYLFGKRYPARYDAACTERWFRNVLTQDALNVLAARTDNAFLVAMLVVLPWLPGDPEVNIVCLCADGDAGWDAIKLLRYSIEWARRRNAAKWRLNSETEYDLLPFALRVGARNISPRFEIDFRS